MESFSLVYLKAKNEEKLKKHFLRPGQKPFCTFKNKKNSFWQL